MSKLELGPEHGARALLQVLLQKKLRHEDVSAGFRKCPASHSKQRAGWRAPAPPHSARLQCPHREPCRFCLRRHKSAHEMGDECDRRGSLSTEL